MQSALLSLAAVLAAVALAPLVADRLGRLMLVPLPVVELTLGMLIGPAVLGWAEPGGVTAALGRMGFAVLVYLAGYELDYRAIGRRRLAVASGGWVVSLGLGLVAGIGVAGAAGAVGIAVAADDGVPLTTTGIYLGIAMTSTALGSILPSLRDSGEISTPFGRAVVAAGAVGQFAPLIALAVVFGGREIWHSAVALVVFAALVAVAVRVASRGMPAWAAHVVRTTMHSSGHFAVRLVVFVVALLAALSVEVFEIDMFIGAFAAGVLVRQLMNGVDDDDRILTERKVQALGFGFLTPVFFVGTGVAVDLEGLAAEPLALALVPVFALLFVVVRGVAGSTTLPLRSPARDRFAAMLWTSVGLAVVVAMVDLGQAAGAVSSVVGSALVGAGMLSLLVFPTIALALRRPELERLGTGQGPGPAGADDLRSRSA